jgi:Protein of unknown function (DUF2946)
MDDIVQQAMTKWPNVPDVYGWLSLSRRGEWRIKGEKISNPIVTEFINRNYTHDDQGRWFFQNGPQRVFVLLEYTPLVFRWNDERIADHTGENIGLISAAFIDETGSLLMKSEKGIGLADDRDLNTFLAYLSDSYGESLSPSVQEKLSDTEPQNWRDLYFRYDKRILAIESLRAEDIPVRFKFNPNPRQPSGEEECY